MCHIRSVQIFQMPEQSLELGGGGGEKRGRGGLLLRKKTGLEDTVGAEVRAAGDVGSCKEIILIAISQEI